jgi:hypothetical protein
MAEEQKRGPGRPRKEASTPEDRKQEAKYGQEFGGTSYATLDEEFERRDALDERAEDRRPATIANRETGETYPDNRQPPQDPLPPRLNAGTITRLPLGEVKRLVKLGVVQFTDEDR